MALIAFNAQANLKRPLERAVVTEEPDAERFGRRRLSDRGQAGWPGSGGVSRASTSRARSLGGGCGSSARYFRIRSMTSRCWIASDDLGLLRGAVRAAVHPMSKARWSSGA